MSKPTCEKCIKLMGKAGKIWSGGYKVQRWRCSKCGTTTTKNSEGVQEILPTVNQ